MQQQVRVEIKCNEGRDIIDESATAKKLTPDDAKLIWCEGPAYSHRTNSLYFSDVRTSTMYVWNCESDKCKVFRKPSHNSNGNCIDKEGRLITCEHRARRITRTILTSATNTEESVAQFYDGKPFNSPNDVIVKSDGSIWFTDPDYGCSVSEGHSSPPQQEGCYVYRLSPDGTEISVVSKDVVRPNGLCFSPDESKLYVVDTGAVTYPKCDEVCKPVVDWNNPHNIRMYDVKNEKELENGKVLIDSFDKSVPDGIRCDVKGNLYAGTWEGVQVFSPDGRQLCVIRTPKTAANCCFGGKENKTLFITATDTVWAIQCKLAGAV